MAGGTWAEKSTQLGQNGLCELGDKTLTALSFIFILMKNDCLVTQSNEFIIRFVWTKKFY